MDIAEGRFTELLADWRSRTLPIHVLLSASAAIVG
jgi:hypothetical protein